MTVGADRGVAAAPLMRVEDRRLLTGRGRFVADQVVDGMAHMWMVRSTHAHARLGSVDASAARATPGVLAVYTGADLVAAGLGALQCRCRVTSRDGQPMRAPERPLLAVERVRYVGDGVAMVVAESVEAAREAAELVDVDYQELPVRARIDAPEAECFDWECGDAPAVAAAFARAARVVSIEVVNNRIAVTPIEPRAALGCWDTGNGSATLYTQSQGVHLIRSVISEALGIAEHRLRVVTNDVGGSFGMKLVAYPEQALVVYAARSLGRAVKWVGGRDDGFLTDAHSRDHRDRGELALDQDGHFLGLRVEVRANLGAYLSTLAPMVPTAALARVLGHVYRIPALSLRTRGLLTHTAPVDAYRGAGKPEIVYLLERLVERAARASGIDRVELRRRNMIPAAGKPYRTPLGATWERGDFAARMDEALAAADWHGFAVRRAAARERGRLRGIGVGPYLHVTGGNTDEVSRIELDASGGFAVYTGTQSTGQGHATAFAQLAAARLEVPMDRVRVVQGDSALIASGGGTGGSSSLPIGAATIARACAKFIAVARDEAARRLEVEAERVAYARGRFSVPGTNLALDLAALAPAAGEPGCVATSAFAGEHVTCPNGVYVCEVEVDPGTGVVEVVAWTGVDDLGVVLNPAVARGQIEGGLAQAIGQALIEEVIYEPEDGQLLTGSLVDYGLPRATDMPHFKLGTAGQPSANNALGMKGAGECGTIGGCAPLVNAVADAIGHDELDMPLTPERVWRALGAVRSLTQVKGD